MVSSANLNDKNNLEEHLLPGLNAKGVPGDLSGVYPFKYNDLEYLKFLVDEKNVGVIKMELLVI